MKYRCLVFVAIFAVMTAIAWPGNVGGEWIADIVYKDGMVSKVRFEFMVNGEELTGSMLGAQEDERPILNGKIKEDKISFIVKEERANRTYTYLYDGKISDDTIRFRAVMLGAGSRPVDFTATRVPR